MEPRQGEGEAHKQRAPEADQRAARLPNLKLSLVLRHPPQRPGHKPNGKVGGRSGTDQAGRCNNSATRRSGLAMVGGKASGAWEADWNRLAGSTPATACCSRLGAAYTQKQHGQRQGQQAGNNHAPVHLLLAHRPQLEASEAAVHLAGRKWGMGVWRVDARAVIRQRSCHVACSNARNKA